MKGMQLRVRGALGLALATLLIVTACGGAPGTQPVGPQLGSAERPIELAFVPSQETQKILSSGDKIAEALEQATGLQFKATVPVSYAVTIESMCSSKVDFAFLAPLSYVLAKDKNCAQLLLTSVRDGQPTFRGQIRVRADSSISDLAGLRGKKFAFSDPVSTSGSMYPQLLIKKQFNQTAKEFFSDIVYAGGHDKAMLALYNGQVDGAASFIDAKTDVPAAAVGLFPDIAQKTKRIAETEDIPGDTVSARKGIPQEIADKVKRALLDYSKTEDGKKVIFGLYSIDGFAEIPDSKYDVLREGAQIVGIDLETEAAKTARPPATPTPTKSP
jgi:phosphonate transport system substrate-binding protein